MLFYWLMVNLLASTGYKNALVAHSQSFSHCQSTETLSWLMGNSLATVGHEGCLLAVNLLATVGHKDTL